jgi:hypothetical protein
MLINHYYHPISIKELLGLLTIVKLHVVAQAKKACECQAGMSVCAANPPRLLHTDESVCFAQLYTCPFGRYLLQKSRFSSAFVCKSELKTEVRISQLEEALCARCRIGFHESLLLSD